tara:strand:+ start:410 stop:1321 length:912 start_codon:yes stop_codon:yes gene_type:complete
MSKETVKTILPFDPCCQEYTVSIYDITPEQAEYILINHNEENRRQSQSQVNKIYNSIERDKFYQDGQPITFNTNGNLTEKQHTLKAIVKFKGTGKTFRFVVVTGVEPDCFSKTHPAKNRTPKDEVLRRDAEATSSQYVILSDIVSRQGKSLRQDNCYDHWMKWKKSIIKGQQIADEFFESTNKECFTFAQKAVGAWATFAYISGNEEEAISLLELIAGEFLSDGESTTLSKGMVDYFGTQKVNHMANAPRITLWYRMLCVGLDKMLERDDGMIEFDYDEDSLTHDNLMKSGRYRKFYSITPKK